MPWFGWYSEREEKIYGYAHYQNKKGEEVAITKITQDPNYKHPYSDAIYMGKLTHFYCVKRWNAIKGKMGEATDRVLSTMEYERSPYIFAPNKIIN
tara:strand:+ start:312 stop:599 length:288 start_codon:yes stop_codon:yes gene_type:complete